ncbi:hypothetical protein KIL84_020170 [Mauremys mutica]|uniref:Uncharacterized protein n=1 Tax=Mauremys mutica TaxID=74926 RepID=A0A9D3XW76_9SAUR|nr:hypothetical protein KIL84_020170 [Mauremys mutica]
MITGPVEKLFVRWTSPDICIALRGYKCIPTDINRYLRNRRALPGTAAAKETERGAGCHSQKPVSRASSSSSVAVPLPTLSIGVGTRLPSSCPWLRSCVKGACTPPDRRDGQLCERDRGRAVGGTAMPEELPAWSAGSWKRQPHVLPLSPL